MNFRRWIYCPACDAENVILHAYDDEEPLYQCLDCGHTFTLDEIDKVYIDNDDKPDGDDTKS